MKLIPIYTTAGDLGAFLAYPYLFNRYGEWIGWVTPNREVFALTGYHVGTMTTTLEVAVSPEDEAEVRRVSISNLGNRTREIDLTSYAEVALASSASDAAHPAFSKLFVQTEFADDVETLLATRRRRGPGEAEVWAAHLAVVEGESVGGVQFESDRARFLGRGNTIRTPISVMDGRPLSGTAGTVLDQIFSLRCRVRVPPGATARVAFWTLVASSREAALDSVDKHHDPTAFDRVVTLAWTQAQVQLHHLGMNGFSSLAFPNQPGQSKILCPEFLSAVRVFRVPFVRDCLGLQRRSIPEFDLHF